MSNEYKDWLAEQIVEEKRSAEKGMCRICDPESSLCDIYKDPMSGDFYYDIQTDERDIIDGDYVHLKLFINYCPCCGRKLK